MQARGRDDRSSGSPGFGHVRLENDKSPPFSASRKLLGREAEGTEKAP